MRLSLLDGIPADDDVRRVRDAVGVQREATRVLAVERQMPTGRLASANSPQRQLFGLPGTRAFGRREVRFYLGFDAQRLRDG